MAEVRELVMVMATVNQSAKDGERCARLLFNFLLLSLAGGILGGQELLGGSRGSQLSLSHRPQGRAWPVLLPV